MGILFKKILVANRGEIATRIFRAATELGVKTVGIYSYEDRASLHRYKADESYMVGEKGNPLASYLNHEAIIQIALDHEVEAIHPGYGFLSENATFARKCRKAGIQFIGPSSEVLEIFGDKVKSKQMAKEAGLNVIPGALAPLESLEEAIGLAHSLKYPVTLKASFGGGGKGIRLIENDETLKREFERAKSESLSSFGNSELFLEKTILNPKHIEIQIMGDAFGNVVHLFERDCSIQRRNQKIVEIAPALGISEKTKADLYNQAVNLGKKVKYEGLGTVEFLVDVEGNAYFLEVNPRIQVEHTVTEVITGIDLAQASILIACGKELSHPAIGIHSQGSIQKRGVAIQCRITTEDPENNFAPSTGKITAYRTGPGFGIRLDEGLGATGAEVTPYYDSLLVKVTASGMDLLGASRKMYRSLSEFRIRGVKNNIALLKNIITHREFLNSSMKTSFLQNHPELFHFQAPKDRATKILSFMAEKIVNNEFKSAPPKNYFEVILPPAPKETLKTKTAKEVYSEGGTKALIDFIKSEKKVLLTDTTMRDAQQSLFATRLRNFDIFKICPYYKEHASDLFSLEMWGGATFDTTYRFLKESPWERLETVRKLIPNVLLQMLFRGDNAVGYANYPAWVIKDFIKETVLAGLDIFRIFDCLNNPSQMKLAIEEVKKNGAIAEASICYTGNISDPKQTKYSLKYYINLAKTLEKMGTDILCIKDMAGLLRPEAAKTLIKELKNETSLPIHLHTHDTSGNGIATLLSAVASGCEIIDGAISSMAGLTSQPSLNSLLASLEDTSLKPKLSREVLENLDLYWEQVRNMYELFEPGIKSTTTRVYEHEIPGGQYSNLFEQAKKVNLSAEEFSDLTKRYAEVNNLFGNIIKVTPSSKVVGDFALLLQKNKLTGPEYKNTKPKLDYPDSVVSFFKGHMGIPEGGFPNEIRELILGPNPPPPQKAPVDKEDNFESVHEELKKKINREVSPQEVLSYRIFDKVFIDYETFKEKFGKLENIPTIPFFYGIKPNEEIAIDIEPGKTLYIILRGISDPDSQGFRTVFFNLNGFRRDVKVLDLSLGKKSGNLKGDSHNPKHVIAKMPGKVIDLKVKVGDSVKEGNPLLVTESMKMEYILTAKVSGKVSSLHVKKLQMLEEGDLLLELE